MDFDRDALIRTFLAETEDNLRQVEESLVALEAEPENAEHLDTVFRGVHTLKGNTGALDLGVPEAVAHAAETLLDRIRDGQLTVTGPLVTLLLATVDALRDVIPRAVAGSVQMTDAHHALTARLMDAALGKPIEADPSLHLPTPMLHERGREGTRTLRVEVVKLDRMLDLTGEIAVARGRLLRQIEDLGPAGAAALEAARETDRLCLGLQELVMGARMVAVGPTLRRHVRTVRDLAAANDRRVRLVIEGEEVEVDTAVMERLLDPLMHMIRNALDHGIEPPDVRKAAGKDPCGTLTLRAFHRTGSVVVEVADDGAGLDRGRILARARERGIVAEGASLSTAEVDALIFEPGFSTAEGVTTLSGRGVGLDVVRRNVEALRGHIAVASRMGAGTTITVRLPLTLAIIDGLAVGVGDERYILPMDAVVECCDLPAGDGRPRGRSGVLEQRGRIVPYARLRDLLGTRGAAPAREAVVLVRGRDGLAGLAVDELHGEVQAVIKPLDEALRRLPGIAGSTILGDGRVALILDVAALLASALAPVEAPA
jgi:two-component system, chemotaxis family, sensor kinase CheA